MSAVAAPEAQWRSAQGPKEGGSASPDWAGDSGDLRKSNLMPLSSAAPTKIRCPGCAEIVRPEDRRLRWAFAARRALGHADWRATDTEGAEGEDAGRLQRNRRGPFSCPGRARSYRYRAGAGCPLDGNPARALSSPRITP